MVAFFAEIGELGAGGTDRGRCGEIEKAQLHLFRLGGSALSGRDGGDPRQNGSGAAIAASPTGTSATLYTRISAMDPLKRHAAGRADAKRNVVIDVKRFVELIEENLGLPEAALFI